MGMKKDTELDGHVSVRAPSAIADAPLAPRSLTGIADAPLAPRSLTGIADAPLAPRSLAGIADAPLAPRSPVGVHERILRLLGMTQRPLRSGELENALGLVAGEARSACRWLTENGYITSTVRMGRAAAHWARTFWSLADKGRSWARAQGALVS